MHAIVFYCTLTAQEDSIFVEGEPLTQEIGYARVSKTEQLLVLQLDTLKKRGVVRVLTDKQTWVRFDRKEFLAAMEYLNEGDTLVVWKLDRFGRSLQQLIETLEKLKKRNIHLVSLTEDVNTSTPTGMLFFQLVAMLAVNVGIT